MDNRTYRYDDRIFELLVLWIWIQPILLQYIEAFITRLPIIGSFSNELLTAFFILLVVLSFPFYRISKVDLIFLSSVCAVFIVEFIIYQEASEYLNDYLVRFLLKIVPLYIVGTSLGRYEKKEKTIEKMYVLAIITLAASILYRFAFGTPMSEAVSKYVGDMDHAYKLLPYCCLIACYAVTNSTIINRISAIIGGFYLLMLGTRGAALLYIALCSFLVIRGQRSKRVIIRAVVVFGVIAAYIVSPLFDASILWMSNVAQQLGLSIRIFDKLAMNSIGAGSGREEIINTLISATFSGPLWGMGLCADRVLTGMYAHNIVIELWVEFGFILGTIMCLGLIITILKGYRNTLNETARNLILALAFSAFFMLFFSGSYLDSRLLMFLLGFCASTKSIDRR